MVLKIYLAGHIPKDNATDWRHDIIDNLRDTSIEFLVPEDIDSDNMSVMAHNRHALIAAKDKYYLNNCDLCVAYLNLEIGHFLGASFEMGYLHSRGVPIILYNKHHDMGRTKFLEMNSDVVVYSFAELLIALKYMLKNSI